MVAFGSFQEMWSNTLSLAVALSTGTQGTGLGTGLGTGQGTGQGTGVGVGTVGVGAGGVGWPLTPNRGSHRGGTQVTFFLPSSWVFHQPLVSFGNAGTSPTSPTLSSAPSSAPSTTTSATPTSTPSATSSVNPSNANAQSLTEAYVAYTLTTPNGTLGQVSVTIHDASYPNAPVFPLGYFR